MTTEVIDHFPSDSPDVEQYQTSITPTVSDDPRELGIPHSSWRPAQRDALTTGLTVVETALQTGERQFLFAEAPTGTGKSGIATGLGAYHQVTVLVNTLALGQQYEDTYGFAFIKGRQAYECVLPAKIEVWAKVGKTPTAHDCHFADMRDCPASDRCPYLLAKQRAMSARRMVCTTPYMMLSEKAQHRTGVLIVDECHHVADNALSFASVTVGEWDRTEHGLPLFPYADSVVGGYGVGGQGDMVNTVARAIVTDWLVESRDALKGQTTGDTIVAARAKRLDDRLRRLQHDFEIGEWFLRSGRAVLTEYDRRVRRYVQSAGIELKPLSATTVAHRLWGDRDAVVLMSATIGKPDALAAELGVAQYDWRTYDHPVPPEARPVYDLGIERMTADNLKAHPELYAEQGKRIIEFIESLDPSWRGIVLTTSNDKVRRLRDQLGATFRRRVYWPDGTSVSDRVEGFFADRRPGLIAVETVQGFGHGLSFDGDEGRFAVIAGVPHVNPTDPYERARKHRTGGQTYQWWTAYNAVMQGAGRVARGELNADGSYMLNVAALADGGATTPTALLFYSGWFNQAIVRW